MAPVQVAQNAIDDARSSCMRTYGSAPDVQVYGDPSFSFAYVPTHLHHMLFELVKNSLRAVQERFLDADHNPPPIRVVVADGLEDVTIKAGLPPTHSLSFNQRGFEQLLTCQSGAGHRFRTRGGESPAAVSRKSGPTSTAQPSRLSTRTVNSTKRPPLCEPMQRQC